MSESSVQPLTRVLGPLGVALLTLSVLSPGASVLVAGADILHHAGTGAPLAFMLGGLLTLVFTFAQAELGSSFPLAGGDYATIGNTLGPLAGFLSFGAAMVGVPVFMAVSVAGVSLYLRTIWPGLPVTGTALAALAVSATLATLNIRTGALLTGIFLAIELGTLALLAGLGFAHPVQSLGAVLTAPMVFSGGTAAPLTAGGLALAIAAASWATSGAGQAIYFTEEMHNPARVGRLVIAITLITIASEVIPVLGVTLGAEHLPSVFASESPFTAFIAQRASPAVALVVTLGIIAALFNASVSGLICYGRMAYSSGRDRIWPAPVNRALTRIHPRLESPWIATLAVAALAAVCCFLSLRMLIILASAGGIAGWILINLAGIAGRQRGLTGRPGTYRAPLFPLTNILSLFGAAGLAVLAWRDVDAGRPGIVAVLVMMALAALYFRFVLSRRPGGWVLHKPEPLFAD